MRHQFVFFGGQTVRIFRVDGREVAVAQRVFAARQFDRALFKVDLVEQQPVVHVERGVAADGLPFELELDDCDRLMHAADAVDIVARRQFLCIQQPWHEALDVAVTVSFVRKQGKRTQADAVAGFDNIEVVVGDGVTQYSCDAGAAAGGRAHPQHIVVAPLDIDRVVVHQHVHNDIRARATVENIADNVQVIDDQPLDQVAHGDDELFCAVGFNDGRNDRVEVFTLVIDVIVLVEQLVDDVAVPARQRAAYFGARVLGGAQTANLKQAADRDAVPLGAVGRGLGQFLQLLLGVVNECGEPGALVGGQAVAQYGVHFVAHRARGVVQDMYESVRLAVQVAHKVFGSLGQAEDSL